MTRNTAAGRIKPSYLLFSVGVLVFMTIELLAALPARADCYYQGKRYRTGQVRGPYVCAPDGTWRPRN